VITPRPSRRQAGGFILTLLLLFMATIAVLCLLAAGITFELAVVPTSGLGPNGDASALRVEPAGAGDADRARLHAGPETTGGVRPDRSALRIAIRVGGADRRPAPTGKRMHRRR